MQELKIPRECFISGDAETQIANEGGEPYEIIGIDYTEDIKLFIKDAQFHWKTFVTGETLFATNIAKSLFIESIKIFTKNRFILATLFTLSSTKRINEIVHIFNRIGWRVLSPYILKETHMTPVTRELQWCIFTFLHNLGIDEEKADKFSMIVSHLIEYDNAYRFRLSDILSETSKEKLQSPRKEIKRLIKIVLSREDSHTSHKYIKIAELLTIALYIPKIRRAFDEVIKDMNLEAMQLDESDKYWLCMKNHYKFMGMTNEERTLYAQEKGWKYPNAML